jgi:putative heme transporter
MTSAVLTAPAPAPAGDPPEPVPATRPGRRWWRLLLVAAGLGLAAYSLRGRLPDPAATWAVLRGAELPWLIAALALQVVSMAAFAEQERHLLAAFGVRMSSLTSLALSYARSAMTTALPAGSAVSAGYAFRQYRARGANRAVAAAVMLLSGVSSVAGLALLYAGNVLAWTTPSRSIVGLLVAVLVALGYAGCKFRAGRSMTAPEASAAPPATVVRRLIATLRETAALAMTVPARRWLTVVALSALNWLTDLTCLVGALHTVGLTVPFRTVATAYLVVQLVRQIPATPGGIGVIEAALILALTTAGAAAAPAAAAVLIYRVLSCWMILPIGLICWTAQRGRHPVPA